MPLVEIEGLEAVKIRKSNPYSNWGNRQDKNRIEPIASPDFDVPFKINKGEKIFTVGSCFARNVERQLSKKGFEIPIDSLFEDNSFVGLDRNIINNFSTPSIYNEFSWAVGKNEFVPKDHIIEVQGGKYVDLHVISSAKPDTYEKVLYRRRAITKAYQSFLDCRIIIMTLGLVEVWYDTDTGYYLNASPRPNMLKKHPGRFKLHVLSYEETVNYLQKAIAVINEFGQPDVKIILTVSPIPLMATHRNSDVIVSNSYSKSALRTAAESLVMQHDNISYFPSYESITHSERSATWKDDFTHVYDDIIMHNVVRMVNAFMCTDWDAKLVREDIRLIGESMAIEYAQKVQNENPDVRDNFFDEFEYYSKSSVFFSIEYAKHLIVKGFQSHALEVLIKISETGNGNGEVQLMIGQILLDIKKPSEAFDFLMELSKACFSNKHWGLLFKAAQELGDESKVCHSKAMWAQALPKQAGRANALTGKWFEKRSNFDKAIELYLLSISLDSQDPLPRLYLSEAYILIGEFDQAKKMAKTIQPRLANEIKLFKRLEAKLSL